MTTILLLTLGCSQPVHMQYDFNRAYVEAMTVQSDRERADAADHAYPLTGPEALEIRHRAFEVATDEETGTPDTVSDD